MKEKVSLKLGGGLKSMLYSCPNHELSREIIIIHDEPDAYDKTSDEIPISIGFSSMIQYHHIAYTMSMHFP